MSSEYCWKRRSFKRLKKESILITITRVLGYKTLPFPAILPFPMQVGAIEHGLSETPHTEHLANQTNPVLARSPSSVPSPPSPSAAQEQEANRSLARLLFSFPSLSVSSWQRRYQVPVKRGSVLGNPRLAHRHQDVKFI